MNKYPHLSNVLNQEFEDISKFQIEGVVSKQAQGLDAVVEQLKQVVTLLEQTGKANEAERKKLEMKETSEKDAAKEIEAIREASPTGMTPKELEEAQGKSKRRIKNIQDQMKRVDLENPRPKSKTERFKNFMEQNRLESEKRKVFGKDKKPKKNIEEEKRKSKEKREKLVAEINRNKKMKEQNEKGVSNLIDRMTGNQEKPNVNNNAGENLTNLYNKRFGSKRFKKSEDNESNWFSSVRI